MTKKIFINLLVSLQFVLSPLAYASNELPVTESPLTESSRPINSMSKSSKETLSPYNHKENNLSKENILDEESTPNSALSIHKRTEKKQLTNQEIDVLRDSAIRSDVKLFNHALCMTLAFFIGTIASGSLVLSNHFDDPTYKEELLRACNTSTNPSNNSDAEEFNRIQILSQFQAIYGHILPLITNTLYLGLNLGEQCGFPYLQETADPRVLAVNPDVDNRGVFNRFRREILNIMFIYGTSQSIILLPYSPYAKSTILAITAGIIATALHMFGSFDLEKKYNEHSNNRLSRSTFKYRPYQSVIMAQTFLWAAMIGSIGMQEINNNRTYSNLKLDKLAQVLPQLILSTGPMISAVGLRHHYGKIIEKNENGLNSIKMMTGNDAKSIGHIKNNMRGLVLSSFIAASNAGSFIDPTITRIRILKNFDPEASLYLTIMILSLAQGILAVKGAQTVINGSALIKLEKEIKTKKDQEKLNGNRHGSFFNNLDEVVDIKEMLKAGRNMVRRLTGIVRPSSKEKNVSSGNEQRIDEILENLGVPTVHEEGSDQD